MRRIFIIIGILCSVISVQAKNTIAVFDVTKAGSQGIKLVEDKETLYVRSRVDGKIVLSPQESSNYYQVPGISFRVETAIPENVESIYLVIDHMDQNLGYMTVSFDATLPDDSRPNPAYTDANEAVGYTCLGTGKARKAIFRLEKPTFQHKQKSGADITIRGVNSVTKLTLKKILKKNEWKKVADNIPTDVTEKVTLTRPLQLVMSAGARIKRREDLPIALNSMNELCPLLKILGFNAVEDYVKWNFVEMEKGNFNWSHYDAIANKAQDYGLKWFPLLIVGSSYALPEWYHDSPDNVGFVCLEHNKTNNIQSIFYDNQNPYVKAFLSEFGKHYEPMGVCQGVRLGPSGNFGESQYPAGGNWGYKWQREHIHIGWWAGDSMASVKFSESLQNKYTNIDALNNAWNEKYVSFKDIKTFYPQFSESDRKRKDFVDWYMQAMTDWCEDWAVWGRQSMPNTDIYESSGGWGFVESGTDFTDQTISMKKINGGIRATNETDSYVQNFYATRMLSSAARFYGVPFGTEPASSGSAKGVAGRIYNILVNNGQHLFFYYRNILQMNQGIEKWLELLPLLDQRDDPVIEVATLYPDTKSKIDDGVFRNLYSFPFNDRVAALRQHLDFDFCSERMVLDNALAQYKVLVFLWSDVVEADVLAKIDDWVQNGGIIIYPYSKKMPLHSVEGDYSIFYKWQRGETGKGQVVFDYGEREPAERYARFVKKQLIDMPTLAPETRRMLLVEKPFNVFTSVLKNGKMALLNYNDDPVTVTIPDKGDVSLKPYDIKLIP